MAILFGKAPGKIILFGEHAVVYGQPAIAIPVNKVNATARIFPEIDAPPGTIYIQAKDIRLEANLDDLDENNPLAEAVRLTLKKISPNHIPSFTLQISSSIPASSGMGSGAAVSVAIIRAISAFFSNPLSFADISDLAYEIEKIYHGTPSGIDNNVVTYQQPVYFMRGTPIQFIKIERPTHWIIADTGERTPTRDTVAAVRANHADDPDTFNLIFNQIGNLTEKARSPLIKGDIPTLGRLMNENQCSLEKLNVSSNKLDTLIEAARSAGAAGAKLSGGGGGGNMIAISTPEKITSIKDALIQAGAEQAIVTQLSESGAG